MADLLVIFMLMTAYLKAWQPHVRHAPRVVFGIEGQPVAQPSGECTDTLIHLN